MEDLRVYVGGQTVNQWGTFKRNKIAILKKGCENHERT